MLNTTYLDDPEKPIHVSLDDLMVISQPGEAFHFEIHQFNEPTEVLFSTKG